MKIKEIKDLEDLEFYLLRDFSNLKLIENDLILENLENSITPSYDIDYSIIIDILKDDKILISYNSKNKKYFISKDIKGFSDYKINDYIYTDTSNDIILKIDENFKIDEQIKENIKKLETSIREYYNLYDIEYKSLKEFIFNENKIINNELMNKYHKYLEEKLKEIKSNADILEAERKGKEKKIKEEQEAKYLTKHKTNLEKFNANEELTLNIRYSEEAVIKDNIIILKSGYGNIKVFLDKNINELFTYAELEKEITDNYYYSNSQSFIKYLKTFFDKNLNFDLEKDNSRIAFKNKNKNYYINNVKVRNSKINFILENLRDFKDYHKEMINIYNKLSLMKIEVLNLKNLNLNSYRADLEIKLPIKISLNGKNDNEFKIEFLNKNNIFKWELIKELLFYGQSRSLRSDIDTQTFKRILDRLKITDKKEYFDYLRKTKLLNSLD